MKAFKQGVAPAVQFDSSGRKLWEFAYSEEFAPIPGGQPQWHRMVFKTSDPTLQAMLVAAGAVEVLQ